MAGHSIQATRWDKNEASKQGFATDNIYEMDGGTMNDHVTGRNARENIQKIVDECLHFVQNFDTEHDNLLFYGATGVGKTSCALHCKGASGT